MVAVGVFRASGALDLLVFAVRPAADFLRIPTEALPMVFLRPISGSASLAMLSDIFKMYGPDSFVGRLASTFMGSTETIFYTLAVYFGAVGIKKHTAYSGCRPYSRFCRCYCRRMDMYEGFRRMRNQNLPESLSNLHRL